MEFLLGFLIGGYLVVGFFNAAMYALGCSITSLGYVNNKSLFKHFIAWPLYPAW